MSEAQFAAWVAALPDLGTGLKRLREMQGLTLREVADLSGLSESYIARLEHGERTPERDTLVALLLAAFSLPVLHANRLLLLAGYAPLHHRGLAGQADGKRSQSRTQQRRTQQRAQPLQRVQPPMPSQRSPYSSRCTRPAESEDQLIGGL